MNERDKEEAWEKYKIKYNIDYATGIDAIGMEEQQTIKIDLYNGIDIGWQARAEIAEKREEELIRERDLAIAHDRQAYPTQWAYDQAFKVLNEYKKENTELKEKVRTLSVEGGHVAWERDDLKKLLNETEKIFTHIMMLDAQDRLEDISGQKIHEAIRNIHKALEDKG